MQGFTSGEAEEGPCSTAWEHRQEMLEEDWKQAKPQCPMALGTMVNPSVQKQCYGFPSLLKNSGNYVNRKSEPSLAAAVEGGVRVMLTLPHPCRQRGLDERHRQSSPAPPPHLCQPGEEVALVPPPAPMPVPMTAREEHLPEVTAHCTAEVLSTPAARSTATLLVQIETCLLLL